MREIATDAAPPSASRYAQGIEVPAGARWLRVSGQIGARPDGSLPADAEGQIEQAWRNVFAVLAAGGMAPGDLVDVVVLLTDRAFVPLYRAARDRMLGGHAPCSTLLVTGLGHPDWLVEIAAWAARVD